MRRIAVYLLVAAATVVIARAIAPVLIVAAIGMVVVAARWPARLNTLIEHPSLARVPSPVRATPMRFAVAVAATSLALVGASSALGPEETIGIQMDEAASQVVAVTSPPATALRPTERPTPDPSPTPEPATTATPAPTPPLTPTPAPTRALGLAPTGPIETATVASVTDGDTIRVVLDGQNVPVRYIGIDTPEIHSGFEWMGPEAAAANERLVAGQQVVLEKDVSETDRYGRLLRYVWLDTDAGWLLVNLELLRLGMAEVTTYPPDVKYVDALYLPAQRIARETGIGLWGAAPAPVATVAPLVGNCEPSYPDVCIPIGAADLDCGDIDARGFSVRWDVPRPDPHRFDGDRDGVGCEG